MRKTIALALGVTMLFAGVTFAADTAHSRMMGIKNSIPVLKNVPITVVSPFSPELRYGETDWAAGAYNPDSMRIFIAPGFWTQTKHVMIHEAGHYAWYNILTDGKRLNYCRVFQNEGKVVSRYSKTNCSENFAEMFAYVNGSRFKMYSDLEEYLANSGQMKLVRALSESMSK